MMNTNDLYQEVEKALLTEMRQAQEMLAKEMITELNINEPDDWKGFDFAPAVYRYVDKNPPTIDGEKLSCKAGVGTDVEYIVTRAGVEEYGNDESGGSGGGLGPVSKPAGTAVWGHHLDVRHTSQTKNPGVVLTRYYKEPHPVIANARNSAISKGAYDMITNAIQTIPWGKFISLKK